MYLNKVLPSSLQYIFLNKVLLEMLERFFKEVKIDMKNNKNIFTKTPVSIFLIL